MSTNHTPGPLVASKGHDGEADRWVVTSAGPIPFIVAVIENGQPGDTLETEGATAHLFAASPDLLAALQGVLRVADRATDEFDAARAAIAKALGKES